MPCLKDLSNIYVSCKTNENLEHIKKILITGCSSGFGYEAVKYLAKKGHYIYASMRNLNTSNA